MSCIRSTALSFFSPLMVKVRVAKFLLRGYALRGAETQNARLWKVQGKKIAWLRSGRRRARLRQLRCKHVLVFRDITNQTQIPEPWNRYSVMLREALMAWGSSCERLHDIKGCRPRSNLSVTPRKQICNSCIHEACVLLTFMHHKPQEPNAKH